MIYSQSSEGVQRRLVFNEVIMSPHRNESLSFQVTDPQNLMFTFNVSFSDEGEPNTTKGELQNNGNILNITLYKWNNSLGTEVSEPIILPLNGRTYLIKFKTWAEPQGHHRTFHVSVWQNL
jgi:hypothetical protein